MCLAQGQSGLVSELGPTFLGSWLTGQFFCSQLYCPQYIYCPHWRALAKWQPDDCICFFSAKSPYIKIGKLCIRIWTSGFSRKTWVHTCAKLAVGINCGFIHVMCFPVHHSLHYSPLPPYWGLLSACHLWSNSQCCISDSRIKRKVSYFLYPCLY